MEQTGYQFSTKVKENILADETVLWAGRPEPFPAKNEANKKSLTMRWLICGALFVVLTVAYVLYSLSIPAGFKPAVVIVLVVVFGYLMLAPVLDHNKVQKKCLYIVTDQRVLTAVGDSAVHAMSRAGLAVNAVPAKNGCVHLLLGTAGDLPQAKYLSKAITALRANSSEEDDGLVLYNVKDTQQLREFFNY